MSVSVQKFWQLVEAAHVLPPDRRIELAQAWQDMKGAARAGSSRTLAEWLVAEGEITRYQAKLLVAGQPGPFRFGDYLLTKRLRRGRLIDCFQAVHVPMQFPVTLRFVRGSDLDGTIEVDNVARAFESRLLEGRLLLPRAALENPQKLHDSRLLAKAAYLPAYEFVDLGAYQFGVFRRVVGEPISERLARRRGRNGHSPGRENDRQAAYLTVLGLARTLGEVHARGQAAGAVRSDTVWIGQTEGRGRRLSLLPRELCEPWPVLLRSAKPWSLGDDPRARAAAEYTAPEFAARHAQATPAADVYAMGCLLYALLAGHPPFSGKSVAEILQQHATEKVPPLPLDLDIGPRERRQAEGLLVRMLTKDPAVRLSSAAEVAHALKELAAGAKSLSENRPGEGDRHNLLRKPPQIEPAPDSFRIGAKWAWDTPSDEQESESAYLAWVAARRVEEPLRAEVEALPVAVPIRAPDLPAAMALAGKVENGRPAAMAPAMSRPINGEAGLEPAESSASIAGESSPTGRFTTAASGGTTERTSRRRPNKVKFAAVVASVAVVCVLGWTAWNGRNRLPTNPGGEQPAASVELQDELGDQGELPAGPPSNEASRQVATGDSPRRAGSLSREDRALWVSPTRGEPLSAAYLPTGIQGILAVRPADLLAHPEGERIVAAAGPYIAELMERLPARAGVEAAEIEQLIAGLGPDGESGLVLRLARRMRYDELASRLSDADEAQVAGQIVLVRGEDEVIWLPPEADGRTLVLAPASDASSVASESGQPTPPLRREIELLLASSDERRHITLVLPPSLLLGDGRDLLQGHAAALGEGLQWLLGPKTQGVLLSGHWHENFFLEMTAVAAADLPPWDLRSQLAARLEELPRRVEDQVLAMDVRPYGRRIVARLPEMLRRMVAYTRSAADSERAVFRCYLPIAAGHNLLMGGEIVLAERHAGGDVETATPHSSPPQSVDQRLAKVTSLSFPRDTLEGALAALSDDIGVPIAILGSDLQVEGITKNQSLTLALTNRPVREILVEILRLANPDKTATGPSDPRQKLVFVIRPDEQGVETIYVTTRKAVEETALPPEFRR